MKKQFLTHVKRSDIKEMPKLLAEKLWGTDTLKEALAKSQAWMHEERDSIVFRMDPPVLGKLYRDLEKGALPLLFWQGQRRHWRCCLSGRAGEGGGGSLNQGKEKNRYKIFIQDSADIVCWVEGVKRKDEGFHEEAKAQEDKKVTWEQTLAC